MVLTETISRVFSSPDIATVTATALGLAQLLLYPATAALAVLFAIAITSNAHAFRAKYYKDCWAPVDAVEDLVADQSNNAETMETVGKTAGYLGSLGGFGGLGGLGSAASTASQVAQYSDIIGDVVAFEEQMRTDHPDPNDRWAAYSDHMSSEAEDLNKVQAAVAEAQVCYDAAYDKLAADIVTGDVKMSKADNYHREIEKGVFETGDVLLAALERVNQNTDAYDQALSNEAKSGGLNLGSLSSLAGMGGLGGYGTMGMANAVASGATAMAYGDASQPAAEPEETSATSQFGTLSQLSSLAGYAGMHAGVPGSVMVHSGTAQAVVGGVEAMASSDDAAPETAAADTSAEIVNPDMAPAAEQPVELTEEQKAAQEMLPSLQKAGKASEEYLALYELSKERAEAQRLLELKVKEEPWD